MAETLQKLRRLSFTVFYSQKYKKSILIHQKKTYEKLFRSSNLFSFMHINQSFYQLLNRGYYEIG